MTLAEFLEELEKLNKEWCQRAGCFIRTTHYNHLGDYDCPITAVYNHKFPNNPKAADQTQEAAKHLGLSERDRVSIVCAADGGLEYTEEVRPDLLRACKL